MFIKLMTISLFNCFLHANVFCYYLKYIYLISVINRVITNVYKCKIIILLNLIFSC